MNNKNLKFQKTIRQIIKEELNFQKIAKMTADNDHNEARLEIAKMLKLTKYITIFESIIKIHNVVRNMPYEFQQFRDKMTDEMLQFIKSKYGESTYKQIYKSL